MARVLDVARFDAAIGAQILRRQARSVMSVLSPAVQTLIDDLIETAQSANGVGIAAPQVSCSDRLFIVASRPTLRYPHAPTLPPIAMINPRILRHSQDKVEGWEGCLSVPGIRGLVSRYRSLEVEYVDRFGDLQHQGLTDFVARIFQHELDHLDGIVFLDRVESPCHLITEAEYQKQIIAS
ncbi:MAG: peptide deformylase [Microcoleaceae cyanobacterium]